MAESDEEKVRRIAREAAEHTERVLAGERVLDYPGLVRIEVGLEALSKLGRLGPDTDPFGYDGLVAGLLLDVADLHRHADYLGIDRATYVRVFLLGWEARERTREA
jgi:hypothetical protein